MKRIKGNRKYVSLLYIPYFDTFQKTIDFLILLCYNDRKGGSKMEKKRVFGYFRVSTAHQLEDRQEQQLKDYGIESRCIFGDKISGKTFDRPEYRRLVGTPEKAGILKEGDLLVICSLDRLGRNYTETGKQWDYITREIGADIKVLDMEILDTTAGSGLERQFMCDLIIKILSYVAEKERLANHKRQSEGYEVMPTDEYGRKVSKRTGRHCGRPEVQFPKNWNEVYQSWVLEEISGVEAIKLLGITKSAFYRLVKRHEAENPNPDRKNRRETPKGCKDKKHKKRTKGAN